MASKKGGKCKRSSYQAKLVSNVGTCVFCRRAVDDELIYGKLYAIGDIQCHYFCALLSCCLIQKGSDAEGLFGFLYPDILAEVERSKKHRCSYCNREGASLGCSVSQCRKQFHLPCGRERDAVSLFYGNYKSFCVNHAPKQKVVESLMPNIKLRIREQRRMKQPRCQQKTDSKEFGDGSNKDSLNAVDTLCVICYEQVEGFPTSRTFWPPCCARDAWFHRSCLQRMALSAGMHYLKCPLCNDKEEFYRAVVNQGYYVPDRDAAWELEQNAFAEIYERPITCSAHSCQCPRGRDHDSDSGLWDIKLCILCGSTAIHAGCMDSTEENTSIYICKICKPAAPGDLEKLIASIEKVQLQEQAAVTVRRRPIMPSRMSLRRTKQRALVSRSGPSSSQNLSQNQCMSTPDKTKIKTELSRIDLNLKKPVRRIFEPVVKNVDNILLSPIKMLEQGLYEKMGQLHNDVTVDSSKVLEKLKEKLKKPRPLVAKKKIINNILDELLTSMLHDPKSKEPLKEWNSPNKTYNIKIEDCNVEEISEDITPTETRTIDEINEGNPFEYKPEKIISLPYTNKTIEKKVCKNGNFRCNFKHKHIELASESSHLRTAIDFAMDAYIDNKRKLPLEDAIPKKKRKFICSMKRKESKKSSENVIDIKIQQSNFEELKTNTDRIKTIHEDVDKDESKTLEKCYINKLKSRDLRRISIDDLDQKTVLKIDNMKPDLVQTTGNVKLDIKVINHDSLKKDDSNMDKRMIVDNEDKLLVSTIPKKKRKKYSSKIRQLEGLKTKATDSDIENKSDLTETKINMDFEKSNKMKKKLLNKAIIDKGSRIDKINVSNKVVTEFSSKSIERVRRNIERSRDSKVNNDDEKRFKKSFKKEKRFKSGNQLDLTLNDNDRNLKLKYKDKHKKKLSIQNKNIKVNIKWKKEQLKLKITGKKENKKKKSKEISSRSLKQYVLKYSPELTSSKETIAKPDNDVTPAKRKYVKTEKHGDNLVQTNISTFFKTAPKLI